MKVLLSQLKKYLPALEADVEEIVNVYTKIGYMLDGQPEKVTYLGKEDYLLDLEVRQNRADLFGVEGLARELSAYYDIPISIENYEIDINLENKPNIEIKAKEVVKRVMAIEIEDMKVQESPEWLTEYLELHGINSINNVVDLTNYVMLETSHSSHAFDASLTKENKLVWEMANNGEKFITLDGTELELSEDIVSISDGETPLSLLMIGGKSTGINLNTNSIILEMAIYDGGTVRRNGRKLKVTTEAGGRLEKYLDPDSIPHAFNMLVAMIVELTGGKIKTGIFDEYIQPTDQIEIWTDLDKVQQIAGIEINHNESVNYLERLGFEIKERNENKILVLRPINRLDIEQEEDVFEEIIRLKGYDNLPTNALLTKPTKDVTPERLNLIDSIKSLLVANGLDEVRSWVLINQDNAEGTVDSSDKIIEVQNSINDEVPFLRPSLISNLTEQAKQLNKQSVEVIQIFEVGKIFYKANSSYSENYSLACLSNSHSIDDLKLILEKIIRSKGISAINYNPLNRSIKYLHPNNSFEVITKDKAIGVIGELNKSEVGIEGTLFEVNIDVLAGIQQNSDASRELTSKLVYLDSNIEASGLNDLNMKINEYINTNSDVLWDISIIDEFEVDSNNTRYTVRFTYFNLTDQEAKSLHTQKFN